MEQAQAYKVAAVNIVDLSVGPPYMQVLALAGYSLIYCLPMTALVLARALLSERVSAAFFGRMTVAVDCASDKLLPSFILIAAILLLGDGARRLARF